MKKIFSILLICITILGCEKKVKRTNFVINGSVEDTYNGIRIHLNVNDERGRLVPSANAIIMDGKFKFTGALDYPKVYTLTMDGVDSYYPLMLENAKMELTVDKTDITKSILTGSVSNIPFSKYYNDLEGQKKELKQNNAKYRSAKSSGNTENIKLYENNRAIIKAEIFNLPYKYIENNLESYSILTIFESELRLKDSDKKRLIELFEKVGVDVKNSTDGKLLAPKINALKVEYEAEKATAIGSIAPPFSAPNTEGNAITLKDVYSNGKVTIVDFWAAWCGPCRRENPNIVKIYEKYHDKGLEIIGVSLDGRRGQQKPKDAWMKAIKDDNLTWHQVSNLNYFGEIAQSYNVNAIPAMFVLDNKGKIIAKNLRGIALERKIAELLD